MGIIKSSDRLSRDDIINIILLIETKLLNESIILYMGYFLDNLDSCESNHKTDKELLEQLNKLIISKFYSNDIDFFKTILINQYFLNKKKFCLYFGLEKIDYEFNNILSQIESMLRELIYIPLKKDTEVKIINNTILNDGIDRDKVYKIKSISVDNLLHYNNTYNRLHDDLTESEHKRIQDEKYFLEENKPFMCTNQQLEKLLYSKQKGGKPKSKRVIHTCPPEFDEIPEYLKLKQNFDNAVREKEKFGYRDGWEIKSIPIPPELLKQDQKSKSWTDSFKDSILGLYKDEYSERAYFINKNMCQRTTSTPPSNIDYDSDDDEENLGDVNTRAEAIRDSTDYLVYNLYRDESTDTKLNNIWYYETDLFPVKIPINPEYNNPYRRKVFSYPLKYIDNSTILENRSVITNEFIHSGIPILWFYKIFKEYFNETLIPEQFNDINNVFNNHNISNLLINFKRLILFNNRFNEETLVFFIILGFIMYITSNITRDNIVNNKPYHLFDTEFIFNDIIKDMIKNSQLNYIPFLNDKIPYILNSELFLEHLERKTENKKDENWKRNLSWLFIGVYLFNTFPIIMSMGSSFFNNYNINSEEFLLKKQAELTEESNIIRNKLYFTHGDKPWIDGLSRKIDPSKQMEYEQLELKLYLIKNELSLINNKLDYIISTKPTLVSESLIDSESNQDFQIVSLDELSFTSPKNFKNSKDFIQLTNFSNSQQMINTYYTNRSSVSESFVKTILTSSQIVHINKILSSCTDCKVQLYVYLHGLEDTEKIAMSNLTHFNYVVVETYNVTVLDLNHHHGTIGVINRKKSDDLLKITRPATQILDKDVPKIEGYTMVPLIIYIPDNENDNTYGIFLSIKNKNGTITQYQLINNDAIKNLLQPLENPMITAPELIQILNGIRQGLYIDTKNIHFATYSCQPFRNETVIQTIPELKKIILKNNKIDFVPKMVQTYLKDTAQEPIKVADVNRDEFKPGQLVSVNHSLNMTDTTEVYYDAYNKNGLLLFKINMHYGTWLNLSNELTKNQIIWDSMTSSQQFLAIMSLKISNKQFINQSDILDAPLDVQKMLNGIKSDILYKILENYKPENWANLLKQTSNSLSGGQSTSHIITNSKLFQLGGKPTKTYEELNDYFDSKVSVSLTDYISTKDFIDINIYEIQKIIKQLIKISENSYNIDDKNLFFSYIEKFIYDYIQVNTNKIFFNMKDEINKIDTKIKNIWIQFTQIKDTYSVYNPDLITLFKKYNKREHIEVSYYSDIITYTWFKYIFLNDLSVDNNEYLLNQINLIDSIQGEPLFINRLQSIPEDNVLEESEIMDKNIIYNQSLLFKLPNYENHIRKHGSKYIDDIKSNYTIFSSLKELYIKYFENIDIQLKKISRDCSKINLIEKLINTDLAQIMKKYYKNTPKYNTEIYNKTNNELENIVIDFNIKYKELLMTTLNEILFYELYN